MHFASKEAAANHVQWVRRFISFGIWSCQRIAAVEVNAVILVFGVHLTMMNEALFSGYQGDI
jgi:hypothetical protein